MRYSSDLVQEGDACTVPLTAGKLCTALTKSTQVQTIDSAYLCRPYNHGFPVIFVLASFMQLYARYREYLMKGHLHMKR
jgi:hypothetical protein